MKVECSTAINAPVDKVVALFTDPGNYKEWQEGFVSYEPISGTPLTEGAKAKITYVNGKHKIELMETILVAKLPREISALYEHKHGENTMINRFNDLPNKKTRLVSGIGYAKAFGGLPKIMALLMPGMFKKRHQKWVDQFKAFAEKTYQSQL